MFCPCGSNQNYKNCCFPLIEQSACPNSAEALMRSRYSAYSLKKHQYIYDTYAESSRKEQNIEEIKSWADETKWAKLTIHPDITPNNTVTFSAYYFTHDAFFKITEHSTFIQENGYWRYLNGEISEHKQLSYPKRNSLCPCESGKKFKVCCQR